MDRAGSPAWSLLAWALGLAVLAATMLSVGAADASSTYDSPYGFDRTWNAAVRLVRVDMGFKILEKDDGTGYLMFEYKAPESGPKSSQGSMEFIKTKDPSAPVRVVVQLPQMPAYHEQVLLDALVRKMRAEYGEPPDRPSTPPPPADAGADAQAP